MLECAADDLRANTRAEIGGQPQAAVRPRTLYHVITGAPERAQEKTRIENAPRGLHVTRPRIPPFLSEISGFRYGSIRERRSLAPLHVGRRRRRRRYALIRNSPPAARCTTGDSKDFSPSNDVYDIKIDVRVSIAATSFTKNHNKNGLNPGHHATATIFSAAYSLVPYLSDRRAGSRRSRR